MREVWLVVVTTAVIDTTLADDEWHGMRECMVDVCGLLVKHRL